MKLDSKPVGILLLMMLIGVSHPVWADLTATKIGDSLVDSSALTIQGGFGQSINGLSFQQDAVVTHAEHQYVAYYDANRKVCLARRELPAGDWRIIRFKDYDFQSNDAHNTISMGICPKDGTIHLAFDHHGHVTWVWRESSQGSNHDLMYAYSENQGKTWLNNAGEPLPEPPHVNSPGITVARASRAHGLMNTHGQAVDSQGRIHVVMWHCTDQTLQAAGSKPGEHRWGPLEARRYHHYWRGRDGRWHHRELPWEAGNRPKILMDRSDNAYMIFGTKRQSAKLADGHLHSAGDLVIAAATAASKWQDWRVIHLEKGPFVNEMLGDIHRWKKEGTLSVMVQGSPKRAHEATPLRILDFSLDKR